MRASQKKNKGKQRRVTIPQQQPSPVNWLLTAADELVEMRSELLMRRDTAVALGALEDGGEWEGLARAVAGELVRLFPEKYDLATLLGEEPAPEPEEVPEPEGALAGEGSMQSEPPPTEPAE